MNDTIAAISTPLGQGGIGIVRMSGKDSLRIAGRIFVPSRGTDLSSCPSHTVHHGHVSDPAGKEGIIDEALLAVMRSPGTYTAEDVVEISCHGGMIPLKRVLETCLSEGARLAQPGEFTKRAFLNGRIDLSQAEAVLDIIKAKTDMACKMAMEHLRGRFSDRIRDLRGRLIDTLSSIELGMDFSDQDAGSVPADKINRDVDDIRLSVKGMLDTCDRGAVLKEGVKAVICGRPNVGKSSLMNALLGRDRMIVTSVAGTTRDTVEESINVAGVMVRLFDTAGIIETRDRVEIEGIKRSRERLEQADMVLFMLDSSCPLSRKDEEIYDTVKGKQTVVIANKIDLPRELDIKDAAGKIGHKEILEVSVLKNEGVDKIEDAIAGKVLTGGTDMTEGMVVTNLRHKELLKKTLASIERGMKAAGEGHNYELLASDLNDAVHHLGLIIGESVGDDVLDRIFSQFCIGK